MVLLIKDVWTCVVIYECNVLFMKRANKQKERKQKCELTFEEKNVLHMKKRTPTKKFKTDKKKLLVTSLIFYFSLVIFNITYIFLNKWLMKCSFI